MPGSNKYIGYAPVLGCCTPPEKQFAGLYLCKQHGWKSADLKAEGEQLKLF